MSFIVRDAVESDYPQIGKLRFDVYKPYIKPGTNVEKRRKDLSEIEHNADILVVVVNDQIVATGVVDLVDDPKYPEFPKGSGYVSHIVVHPNFRRRGIARALITEIQKRAVYAGKTSLILRTADNMLEAQQMYHKLGFKREPTIDYKYPRTTLLAYSFDLKKLQ